MRIDVGRRSARSWSRRRLIVDEPGPGKDISSYISRLQALPSHQFDPDHHSIVNMESVGGAWQLPDRSEAARLSDAIKSVTGVRPISFSFPSSLAPNKVPRKTQLLAQIFPSAPYSFESASDYYAEYSKSFYALTHRKAGWDCFRHVEMLAHGALPLMPDIDLVPRATMIHYPKQLMSSISSQPLAGAPIPSASALSTIAQFVRSNLTTTAMTKYILETSLPSRARQVLFIDESLSTTPDYLSLLTLIGLKELMGTACHSWFSTDYLYLDYGQDASRLYGQGFGYTKVLSPDVRSPTVHKTSRSELKKVLRTDSFDAVIVGSAPRNPQLTRLILANFPPSNVILLDGEDRPPSRDLLEQYASLGSHVFVRELETFGLMGVK